MKNSKTIQTCEKVAKEYNKEMENIFSKLRKQTLRAKVHHNANLILNK